MGLELIDREFFVRLWSAAQDRCARELVLVLDLRA